MVPVADDTDSKNEGDRLIKVVPLQDTWLRCVVPVLMLAVAYAVVARLGLWFAIPPGYATAIWPASGLALAGVLLGGARVGLGIWLGSFVANLWTEWDTSHAATLLTSIAIPTSIGVGATAQALVGASLVRRWVDFPSPLTDARDIGAFLLLGGPLSCLVSATVGVTSLVVSGQIPWSLTAITWWTWWVGDTLGVLIATPLVLSWLAEPRGSWRRRRLSVGLPLVVGLALSFVILGYMRAQEWERLRHFEQQAEHLVHTLQTRLDDHVDVLRAFEHFSAGVPEVKQEAFHTFAQRSFARYPGLQALLLGLRMPDARWEAHTQAVRPKGVGDLQSVEQTVQGATVQAGQHPQDIAVTYLEPRAENEATFGFDVLSVPDSLEAMQQARDTGQPQATGRLTLGQDPGRHFVLLVFLPLYDSALPHATVEERRRNLHGYITGMFQIGNMVEAALQGLKQAGIVLRIEDEAAPADRRLLYNSHAREPEGESPAREVARGKPPMRMHWQTTVELANRRWGLHFAPTLVYQAARQSLQPWTVLSSGLPFVGLLGVFLLIVTGRATVIEQLIDERTAQLAASQRLEAEAVQRRHEAEVLAELARTINAALEVDTVLQRVTDGARELCDSDGAAIALCELGADAAVICYWAGRSYRGFQGVRIAPGEGIGGLVLATGRSYRTDDYGHDPRVSQAYRAVTQAGGTVAVLVVPIRCGARVEGLLYVDATRPRTYTDAEETILQRLADHAAIALHNARLYAAAEQRRQTAESMTEVGHLLSQSLDATEVSQRVVEHVRRFLQTRAATLYQLEPASGMLIPLATATDDGAATIPWRALPLGMGAVGLAVCTRQLVVTTDILTDPRLTFPAAVRAGLEASPVRAVLALPLLCDGRVIGALSLGDEAGRTFEAEALAWAWLFADHAATALTNAQLYTAVQAGQVRLQDLSHKLLEAHEAERRRIAHELHDEAGQLLASVHIALETTILGLPPQFQEGFHQVRSHLDAIETQLRCLAHDLRPTILDDLGLLPALQGVVQRVAERTGLGIRVDIGLAGRLAPAVETALYRIMQEGLTNIAKHAAATHVDLQLWRDDQRVHGLLRDDGVGFAVEHVLGQTRPRGLGLLGIQERLEALGGTLQITSAAGQGTTLQITLPAAVPHPVAGGALPQYLWSSAGAH
jgi:signal transduction histidine kinase/CHASE1-domain containing sensor protein